MAFDELSIVNALQSNFAALSKKMERMTPAQKKNLLHYSATVHMLVKQSKFIDEVLDRAIREELKPV